MADLVVLFVSSASGEATIGAQVAEALGYRFLHNHLTANPVAALFGWVTPKFGIVVNAVRELLMAREGTAFRRRRKPNQDDLSAARARQQTHEQQYRMITAAAWSLPYPQLVLDTEAQSESVAQIAEFVRAEA